MVIDKAIAFFGSQVELAKVCSVTQQAISKWSHGKSKPSLASSVKIEEASDGLITREDLRPDIFVVRDKKNVA